MSVKDLIKFFEAMSAEEPTIRGVLPVSNNLKRLENNEPAVATKHATAKKQNKTAEKPKNEQLLDINKYARKVPTPHLTGVQWLNLRGFAHKIKMKRVAERNKREGKPPPDPHENESGFDKFVRGLQERIRQKGREPKTVLRNRCCDDTYSDLDALVREANSVEGVEKKQTRPKNFDGFSKQTNCTLIKEPFMYKYLRKISRIISNVLGCCNDTFNA
ncbi:hypothetical protein THOM_3071 [Trachipleistophora hominis]|uniref:Uncharacterized protein n=1 Tax=Trachipleistophora hominis TaxID=72359 RepID=L7JRU3_TRAHO|nr:hypothetical protein THOM_3071 [Trachipleistophora hominis]